MLTISNGWLNSAISYSRIVNITDSALENAASGRADNSREMGLGEKIVDYIFCGSVKKEYMDYLYRMTRNKALLESELTKGDATIHTFRASQLRDKVEKNLKRINQITVESTVELGTDSSVNLHKGGSYLIYREKHSHLIKCLPLNYYRGQAFLTVPDTDSPFSIPEFETIGHIQIEDLAAIKQNGKLRCGGEIYTVKFTKNNEPLVIQMSDIRQAEAIQRRLQTLWNSSNVKERLTDLRSRILKDTTWHLYDMRMYWSQSDQDFSASTYWKNLRSTFQEKFTAAVAASNARFDIESMMIDDELDRLEKLTDPAQADEGTFLLLHEKITSLERALDAANDNIWRLKTELGKICIQEQVSQTLPSTLPARKPGQNNIAEKVDVAMGAIVSADGETFEPFHSETIPTFKTPQEIFVCHFEQILARKQFSCGGKTYQVRVHNRYELIVLCDSADSHLEMVQYRLFKVWKSFRAKLALDELNNMPKSDNILASPPAFPEVETDRTKIGAELDPEQAWLLTADAAKKKFTHTIQLVQAYVTAKEEELVEIFKKLNSGEFPAAEQRKILLESEARLLDLMVQQDNVNKSIIYCKRMYEKLFILARDCTNATMQDIVLKRIDRFNAVLDEFTKTDMSSDPVKKLNIALRNQITFLEKFDHALQLRCSTLLSAAPVITLKDGRRITAAPISNELRKQQDALKSLLENLSTPWEKIHDALENLQRERERFIKTYSIKLNTGIDLDLEFGGFMGHRGEGLHPETGKSFYTPKTYSRIVSLMEIRAELLDIHTTLSEQQLNNKIIEMNQHIIHIQRENAEIDAYTKSTGFVTHKMYQPDPGTDGLPMNFEQWCEELECRARYRN